MEALAQLLLEGSALTMVDSTAETRSSMVKRPRSLRQPLDQMRRAFGQSELTPLDRFLAWRRFALVAPLIPQDAIVVDLGCGYRAHLLGRLASHIQKGIGLDLTVSDEEISQNVVLRAASVDAPLPVDDNSATVVCMLAVLEHLVEPHACLRECHRILRPGGTLLLTTPSLASQRLLEFLAFRLKIISHEEIADHKRYYTCGRLRDELQRAGFLGANINIRTFECRLNLFAQAKK